VLLHTPSRSRAASQHSKGPHRLYARSPSGFIGGFHEERLDAQSERNSLAGRTV
jgi:hypothetical protein